MNQEAIKDLLLRTGDDELVIGHRNSEWTGLGPILEEDIAFSSMAQDEVGHAQAYYALLQEHFGGPDPDVTGFQRKAAEMKCCKLVEYPIGDYAFSLVRHVLYDFAENIRLRELSKCSFAPLAELAKKLAREEKYHLLHARIWLKQLSDGGEDSKTRLQNALNTAFPLALGLFEPSVYDSALKQDGILPLESELEAAWMKDISEFISSCGLQIPVVTDKKSQYGGRTGNHSEFLPPLLDEMCEVTAIDPKAVW